LLKDEKDWKKFLKIIIAAAFLVILYGLPAGAIKGIIGPSFSLQTRFQGSLGNPDYIGQFMLFAIFFSLYLALKGISQNDKWIYGSWALLFFLTFLLSQTRGAFLGLLAGIFMVLIFLIFKARKKLKVTAAVILLFFIMAGGLFIVFRHSPFIKNLPIVGRFADIFLQSGAPRLWT